MIKPSPPARKHPTPSSFGHVPSPTPTDRYRSASEQRTEVLAAPAEIRKRTSATYDTRPPRLADFYAARETTQVALARIGWKPSVNGTLPKDSELFTLLDIKVDSTFSVYLILLVSEK